MLLLLVLAAPVAAYGPEEEGTVNLLVPRDTDTQGLRTQSAVDASVPWKRITVPMRGTIARTRASMQRELGATVLVERSYSLLGGEDEPGFAEQWALENTGQDQGTPDADIDAMAAWSVATGEGVVVAVVDSGVEVTHPELDAQIWQNSDESANGSDDDENGYVDDVYGWDFEARDADPSPDGDPDMEAHATLIAGIIAAEVNDEGIAGVAPGAEIMNLRACRDGSCLTLNAVEAMYYAVDNGADIINLSFGGPLPEGESDPPLEQAIEYARQNDVLVVSAAGNTPPELLDGYVILPAEMSHSNNLAVASTDRHDRVDDQSYYGESIDLAAPGVDILSTALTSYAVVTGTSFAAPHVAGVAALLLSAEPGISHLELVARIKAWADRPADVAGKVEAGRVNAGSVLNNRFIDTLGHTFWGDAQWAAATGITRGCNPPQNTWFCPDEPVTRGQVAAFFNRQLGLPAAAKDHFVDDNGSTFENDINAIAEAGITKGCNPPDNDRFCPADPMSREQMAAFLVRAMRLTTDDHPGFDDVAPGSTFEADIGRLATAGMTRGCNPPDNTSYCPKEDVTRGQMIAFLHRSEE